MGTLYTVRKEARLPDCPYTEHRLRLMIAQGLCPGVRVGNRFMVLHEALLEQVRQEAQVKGKGKEIAQG